jgi:hypothetical protein
MQARRFLLLQEAHEFVSQRHEMADAERQWAAFVPTFAVQASTMHVATNERYSRLRSSDLLTAQCARGFARIEARHTPEKASRSVFLDEIAEKTTRETADKLHHCPAVPAT